MQTRVISTIALTLSMSAPLHGGIATAQSPTIVKAREIRLWEILPDGGGQPTSLAMDQRGRVVIAQRNPAVVYVLDSTGRLLRSFGQPGRGPGEFGLPSAVLRGDSVVVWDGQLRRLSVFAIATGRLIRDANVRVSGSLMGISNAGQVYLRNPMSTLERDESGISVVRVNTRGETLDTLQYRLRDSTASRAASVWRVKMTGGGGYATAIPFVPRPLVALHPDGSLIVSWPPSHVIQKLTPPSTVRPVYRAELPQRRIPSDRRAAARDSALAADAPRTGRAALAPFYRLEDIPEYFPPWSRIDVDGMGRLVTTDPSVAGGLHRFVFSSNDGRTRTAQELASRNVGPLQAWSGSWFASLADAEEGTLLTLFRVR